MRTLSGVPQPLESSALAYFITFRTYGTWLQGDAPGSTTRYRLESDALATGPWRSTTRPDARSDATVPRPHGSGPSSEYTARRAATP